MWDGHLHRFREIATAISEFDSAPEAPRTEDFSENEELWRAYVEEVTLAAERLSNYTKAALKDSKALLDSLYLGSRYSEPVNYSHNIEYYVTDHLSFDAFTQIISPSQVQIVMSLGVFLAVEDLFLRLVSNMDFYSFDPSKEGSRQWHGCKCLWAEGGIWTPNTRYYDYRILQDISKVPNKVRISHLFAFHMSIPFDTQRLALACFMVDVGLLWIFMHEEAHYTEGHLSFLESQYGSVFSKQKLGEVNQEFDQDSPIPLDLQKAMEFQADCVATHSVVDVFCKEEFLKIVPGYCDDKLTWFLRLLIVSIGSVVLVLQKSHSIYGSADNYPLPLTRLTTVIRYVLGRVRDQQHPSYRMFMNLSDTEFNQAVIGALDDLQTVSSLLTREGKIEESKDGKAPVFMKTHDLGILDKFNESELEFLSLVITLDPLLQSFLLHFQADDSPEEEKSFKLWIENQRQAVPGSKSVKVPLFMLKSMIKAQGISVEKYLDGGIEDIFRSLQYSEDVDRSRLMNLFEAWFLEYFSMEKNCFYLKQKTANLIPIRKLMG